MSPQSNSATIGLLILRVTLGALLIAHGVQKLFIWGIEGTQASYVEMGVPVAEASAIATIVVEFLGGALIVLGLGTRVVGILVAIVMASALFLVHIAAGPFASDGGYELVLIYGVVGLALAFTGAGRVSIDSAIAGRNK